MKKVLLLLLFICIGSNIAQAAIKVSPATIEIDANKTKKDYIADSFTVAGAKNETIRFKIYPEFYTYDENGHFKELEDKGQKDSLMGKIKFYPQEFTCKDGIDQKVRFTITDLKSLPQGESRIVLFLEDVNTKEVLIKKANGKIGGKIIVKTRMGVPIYVNKGHYTKNGTLDNIALKQDNDQLIYEYKISSTGNSQIRYQGLAFLSKENSLIEKYELHGSTILGGSTIKKSQKFEFPKEKLKPGEEYNVKFVLMYKDENEKEKVLKKEFKFIPEISTQNIEEKQKQI